MLAKFMWSNFISLTFTKREKQWDLYASLKKYIKEVNGEQNTLFCGEFI